MTEEPAAVALGLVGQVKAARELGAELSWLLPSHRPGVTATFTGDPSGTSTISFVVPAGGTPPITVTINTDRDRITAWIFFDCIITSEASLRVMIGAGGGPVCRLSSCRSTG